MGQFRVSPALIGSLVVLSMATAAPLGAQTQSRPDLSGSWVLTEAPAGFGPAPFGRTFDALQDDAILSLELTSFYVMGHTEPTARHPTVTYRFDGAETRHPLLALARPESGLSPSATGFRTQDWVTRAGWEGGRLVIVTYAARRVQVPALVAEPATHRMMTRQELWIDDAGQLVIETSSVADPAFARLLATSGEGRVVYRRVASGDIGL